MFWCPREKIADSHSGGKQIKVNVNEPWGYCSGPPTPTHITDSQISGLFYLKFFYQKPQNWEICRRTLQLPRTSVGDLKAVVLLQNNLWNRLEREMVALQAIITLGILLRNIFLRKKQSHLKDFFIHQIMYLLKIFENSQSKYYFRWPLYLSRKGYLFAMKFMNSLLCSICKKMLCYKKNYTQDNGNPILSSYLTRYANISRVVHNVVF